MNRFGTALGDGTQISQHRQAFFISGDCMEHCNQINQIQLRDKNENSNLEFKTTF
jgi:hypothetical protein